MGERWIFVERRRGPDIWVRAMTWLSVTGWLLLIAALMVTAMAKAEVETFFERYYQLPLRRHWDVDLIYFTFYAMLTGLGVCLLGLLINLRRSRRRHDSLRSSLILLGLLFASGTLLCLKFF